MRSSRRQNERGFALLLIFLMAAAIAITLYMEIPRVAFESQRQKELLLIERGEQYKRAIQLFVKKNSRYPARIEELESFNNQRYLRRRYKDPITGKDEWKLIQVGPGGVFTNSLVNKPKTGTDQKQANLNTFIREGPAIGSTVAPGAQSVNPAMRRRASEGGQNSGVVLGPDGQPIQPQPSAVSTTGIAGMPGTTGQGTPQYPGQFPGQATGQGTPQYPVQYPGQPGQMAGQTMPGQGIPGQPTADPSGQAIAGQTNPATVYPGQGAPGQPMAGQAIPGMGIPGGIPGQPGYPTQVVGGRFPGANPTNPTASASSTSSGSGSFIGSGSSYIGGSATPASGTGTTPVRYPGMPGAPVNSQTGGVSPYSTVPGAQGVSPQYPQPGMNVVNPSNAAVNLIQQILTSPRPGGMPGPNAGMQGLNIGPGIAGVASTSEDEGILVYNEHTKYIEWEFIYDPTKEKRVANPAAGLTGTPASQMGSGIQGTQPGQQPSSTFGNSSGFSGFGNSGFGNSGVGNSGFGNSGFGNSGASPGSSQPQTGFGRP